MAVRIRLKRMGAKKRPFYRVIVADSRAPREGRFIETLGYYDPCTEPATVRIDQEKVKMWLERGAQPTEAVSILLNKLEAQQSQTEQEGRMPSQSETAEAESSEQQDDSAG
ncbi:MAG: 30S ribosomal protein S16 [Armatimonadota bacterium]